MTSEGKRASVAEKFGINDAAPVVCEPFSQWVLEDNFPLGRPALEKVGVEFVEDIQPFETMKLRILNAGHAAISYPAALLDIECVHEAMADTDIKAWLMQLMCEEVVPVLDPIPGVDYHAYLSTCVTRFSNPEVRDTIARLCQDGSNRQPKFVLSTVAAALQRGRPVDGLALEIALWCRYCAETSELDDPRAPELKRAALDTRHDPTAFLLLTDVFGNLSQNDRFAECFSQHIEALWLSDARSILRGYLSRMAN